MDLQPYYEEFAGTYGIALFATIFTFAVMLFCSIRRIIDTKRVWEKIAFCIAYFLIFLFVFYNFWGAYMQKKDIEEQTIYAHEGSFEITEIDWGIYNHATVVIGGKEMRLKFSNNADVFPMREGVHTGQIVYAEHYAYILYMKIDENISTEP